MSEAEEIQEWIHKIMMSPDQNWTKVEGLLDWLAVANKDTRIKLHEKRIAAELRHNSPVNRLLNLGDKVRILEIKALELQRLRTLEGKHYLLRNPKTQKTIRLWLSLRRRKASELVKKLEVRIDKKMKKTSVKLETLISLLEN